MKINVTGPLYRLDGSELTTQTEDVELCESCTEKWRNAKKPLTLRLVCTQALTAITQESQKLDGQKKFERAALARRIYENDEPSLNADDIVLLKNVIGIIQGPIVVLQAYELLDPADEE